MESLNENQLSAKHILVKIQRTLVKIEKMSIKGVLRVFILCITYGVIYMPSEYNMTSLELSRNSRFQFQTTTLPPRTFQELYFIIEYPRTKK